VTAEEEWRRLSPALERIRGALPKLPLSVDTTKAEVARRALDAGADAVNDISAGLLDPAMFPLVAERGASLVLMHMRGVPKSMQEEPQYSDAPREVAAGLGERLATALRAGVAEERIALDPGIGFGKRTEDNVALLSDLSPLLVLGRPVLIGASRKSVVGALTGAEVGERLPGTIALHVAALLGGARIFRVHDVAAHRQALTCAAAIAAAQKR
jgi:dihydropteroate synthase